MKNTSCKLPKKCYAVLGDTGQLIVIKAKQPGYRIITIGGNSVVGHEALKVCKALNEALDVSDAQMKAMTKYAIKHPI